MTLVVETASGVYLRTILPAALLPEGIPVGDAAEDATKDAAARWGLPDFVFNSAQSTRGSARREVGDAIVVVGSVGASVQVKARQIDAGDETRERSWLDKKIEQASRQAAGTIKSLKSNRQTVLVNQRGRQVAIDGSEKSWLPVVVLHHRGVAGYIPASSAVVLLRRDWEFLFQQLKSTYAVLEYLMRVKDMEPIPLGEEPVRYYQLAAADAVTPPNPKLPYESRSGPLLPQTPAGNDNLRDHSFLRAVMEDIANVEAGPQGIQPSDVLAVLAAIDAAPITQRSEMGRTMVNWLRELSKLPPSGGVTWRFRNHFWPERPYLLFGAANKLVQEGFNAFLVLRHQQQLDLMPERAGMLTVGVLLTPRRDGLRPWDTTAAATRGHQQIEKGDRTELEALWGKLGQSMP